MSASGVAEGTRGHDGANEAADGALTVFPKHPSAPDTYYIGGAWAPAAITATDKRFSEAELAAEYWCEYAEHLYWAPERGRLHSEQEHLHKQSGLWAETLERFAKLPHHDQEDT